MPRYAASVNNAGPATTVAYANLWTPAARTARLVRVEFAERGTTAATDLGLQRTTARGTQTATAVGQAFDPLSGASTVQYDQTWSVAPTFSGTNIILSSLPSLAGSGFVWDFTDSPIIVAAASGIALRNIGAGSGSPAVVTFYWDEQ